MPLPDDKEMKILIADDSPNMLRTLANMLRLMGYKNILRADNGETALIKMRSDKVDMILSDWNMPKMTGIEVLRVVRDDEKMKDIPFLMITGEVDQQTVAQAGEEDVDGYLLKPFTQEDLKTKLEEILNRKRNPSQVDVHISVAKVYLEARQWERALDELREALKMSPRSPRVSYALGEVHEAMGDMSTAKKLYLRSIEFGHHFLKGHEAAARIYQAQGQVEAAAEHLQKAVSISPKNLDRQLSLSKVLIQTGDKEGVRRVLQNVMALAEKDKADIAREVGEIYLEAGLAAEAQEAFGQALNADPKDVYLYNRMGMALRRQKKFQEAVQTYRKGLGLEPDNENLYYNMGRALYEAGEAEKAAAAMKKALSIFPDFTEAREFLEKLEKE
ncbi:MAG: tetratricopeptide repeat protein [Thermodesulfobacteriota bacterium]